MSAKRKNWLHNWNCATVAKKRTKCWLRLVFSLGFSYTEESLQFNK